MALRSFKNPHEKYWVRLPLSFDPLSKEFKVPYVEYESDKLWIIKKSIRDKNDILHKINYASEGDYLLIIPDLNRNYHVYPYLPKLYRTEFMIKCKIYWKAAKVFLFKYIMPEKVVKWQFQNTKENNKLISAKYNYFDDRTMDILFRRFDDASKPDKKTSDFEISFCVDQGLVFTHS
jgi:hypothetical protein